MHRYTGGFAAVAVTVLALPASATPPGSNGSIVWQREPQSGLPHLWVANADGSGSRQVFGTARKRGEIEGTFSPTDPSLLLFTRVSRSPFSGDIYSGDLATAEEARVTRARSADVAPAVSPDGTRLAYFAFSRPRQFDPDDPPPPARIHTADPDGSGDRPITPRRRSSIDPDWSPDGKQIAYAEARFVGRHNERQNRLMLMNADGTGRRPLTGFAGPNEINPKWMPDGQTIVFEREREGGTRSDILTMSVAGGASQPILATRAWETNPVPSPDGTRIVFTSDRDRRGQERLGPGFEIYTMGLDGSGLVRLTNNRRPDIWPDWQRLP